MTLETTDNDISYDGDGSSQTFSIPFRYYRAADIRCRVIAADGTVSDPAKTVSDPGAAGGSLTLTSAPPAVGEKVYIWRDTAPLQSAKYKGRSDFPAELHEDSFDRRTMADQDVGSRLDRAIRVARFESPVDVLPRPVERQGRLVTFDADGNPQIAKVAASGLADRIPAGDVIATRTYVEQIAGGLDISLETMDFANLGEARTETIPPARAFVRLAGLSVAGDGGGGLYKRVGAEPSHPGKWKDKAGAWFELVPERGAIDVRRTGAALDWDGSTGTDDAMALADAIAAAIALDAEVYAPPNRRMYLGSAVDARGLRFSDIRTDIEVDPAIADIPVTFGEVSGYFNLKIGSVTDGTSTVAGAIPSRPIVRFVGFKTGQIEIGDCNYVQFYADGSTSIRRSFAYSNVKFKGVVRLVELTDSGDGTTGVPWVNENNFHGGRLYALHIKGNFYTHDHNYFFRPVMEGPDVELIFNNCVSNTVFGARFEAVSAGTGVTFDAAAYGNKVISTHSKSGTPRNQFIVPIPVTDHNGGNLVSTESAYQFNKTKVWSVTPESLIIGAAGDGVAQSSAIAPAGYGNLAARLWVEPGLADVNCKQGNRWVALSEMIPVQRGDVGTWDVDYDGSLGRGVIWIFDAERRPITAEGAGGVYISAPSMSLFTDGGLGCYRHTGGMEAWVFNEGAWAVARSEVAYVRVGFYLTSPGRIRGASSFVWTQSLGRGLTEATQERAVPISVAGIPSKGLPPEGCMVYNSTGLAWYRCPYRHETVLASAAATSATTIDIWRNGSVVVNDNVGILLDDGSTHWTLVSAISGNTITLNDAMPYAASEGARVVFVRWV